MLWESLKDPRPRCSKGDASLWCPRLVPGPLTPATGLFIRNSAFQNPASEPREGPSQQQGDFHAPSSLETVSQSLTQLFLEILNLCLPLCFSDIMHLLIVYVCVFFTKYMLSITSSPSFTFLIYFYMCEYAWHTRPCGCKDAHAVWKLAEDTR